jgi:hypothetical protein
MKTSSPYLKFSLFLAGTIALTAVTLVANPPGSPHKRGTDILHYFVRKAMFNEGVVSDAAGSIYARQNKQGNANNQDLDITVKGLEINTAYQLLALVDAATSFTNVAEFSTDSKGRATLHYRQRGNGKGLGHGKSPLPDLLDPVSLVRELRICSSGSTQAVLKADLTAPDKLQYLIKRDLSTNAVSASLQIKSNLRQTQFKLLSTGLSPANEYQLVLNGGVVETYTADSKGRLVISSPLAIPAEILDLRSVALWDSAGNSVVSATLP